MQRYICLHGHFYQPPRENPWLEAIELQDSAYPNHDWNERITSECYASNGASRIMDGDGRIVRIVNNYARISFNFGPTLLSWMEENVPFVYKAILAADQESQRLYNGHGSALAQAYNHIIMPLANRRDKETQIRWGIEDFRRRFGRDPEGMWLAETAVDIETLEIMAEHGITFTILSPYQAGRIRPLKTDDDDEMADDAVGTIDAEESDGAQEPDVLPEPVEPAKQEKIERITETATEQAPGIVAEAVAMSTTVADADIEVDADIDRDATTSEDIESVETTTEDTGFDDGEEHVPPEEHWHDVTGGHIDPTRAYRQQLPSGRTIDIFFYDGPVSQAVAFEGLLRQGEFFANRLCEAFSDERPWPQIVHIATDGETYGHHHKCGDMALAYALHYIETNNLAQLTIYGEYLENHPPEYEVEILENTSWSCYHGIERWRSNCGCNSGLHAAWNQEWRAPLRDALDWLRDTVHSLYEQHAGQFLFDPWKARNAYISVIFDRSREHFDCFLGDHATRYLSEPEKVTLLKLLELQRHAMLMYTSCGWFFDELSGIETVQIIQYAGRVIQLAQETLSLRGAMGGDAIEAEFLQRLSYAKSNIPEHQDGAVIYQKFVKPAMLDLGSVLAHYAVSTLFEAYTSHTTSIFCYVVDCPDLKILEHGRMKLAIGHASVTSTITRDSAVYSFAVLHLGDLNTTGGVREYQRASFDAMVSQITGAFQRGDVEETTRLLNTHFMQMPYSLRTLFRDEQRKVLDMILTSSLEATEASYREIYDNTAPLMRFLADLHIPLPKAFRTAADFVLNTDLRRAFEHEDIDIERIKMILDEVRCENIELDTTGLIYTIRETLEWMGGRLTHDPNNVELLRKIEVFVDLARTLPCEIDVWELQNIYYDLQQTLRASYEERAGQGDEGARMWLNIFTLLGDRLGFRV